MRTIKVLSTTGVSSPIITDVMTFGALKPLLLENGIDVNVLTVLISPSKAELSLDEAILPEGDIRLYVMPKATKSGSDRETILNRISSRFEDLGCLFSELAEIEEQRGCNDNRSVTNNNSSFNQAVSAEDLADIEELRNLSRNTNLDD